MLDNATMPVVGDPRRVNNTYVEQIVASAKAAIDKAVEMGVTDPERVGVGGHSYGAFMTANLLAHSRPVPGRHRPQRRLQPHADAVRLPERAAHVLGGARRSTLKMSPFMYADKINEPMLLIHGEADDNPGTFPIQSERLYQAIRGNGGNGAAGDAAVRGPRLRGPRIDRAHVLSEMIAWFDKYVKQ